MKTSKTQKPQQYFNTTLQEYLGNELYKRMAWLDDLFNDDPLTNPYKVMWDIADIDGEPIHVDDDAGTRKQNTELKKQFCIARNCNPEHVHFIRDFADFRGNITEQSVLFRNDRKFSQPVLFKCDEHHYVAIQRGRGEYAIRLKLMEV